MLQREWLQNSAKRTHYTCFSSFACVPLYLSDCLSKYVQLVLNKMCCYIYAFGRHFYTKLPILPSSCTFFIIHAFYENQTNLGAARDCLNFTVWATSSADPILLGVLCKTVSLAEEGGRGGVIIDETHLSAFHSISNRAHGKRLRNSISSVVHDFFFFFFMQETVRRSRYMIWLTFYVERVTAHCIK